MSLRVIGAGFGRTGTASLKEALEILGMGPCHHFFEIRRAPWKARQWLDVVRGSPPHWDTILAGYGSTVDWPSCAFFEELSDAFPDAPVILTTRDPSDWYESTHRTLHALRRALPGWVRWMPVAKEVQALLDELIWEGTFEGRFDDRAHALAVFQAHAETVVRRVPAERLLVYRVEEGWEPLCAFLGVDVPDVPFPWVNQRAEIERAVKAIRVANALLPAAVVLLGFWLLGHLAGP